MIYYTQRCLTVSLLFLICLSVAQAQTQQFTLQVKALDSLTPALELVQQLKSSGVDAYYTKTMIPGKGLFYRVRVGSFANLTAAEKMGEQLRRERLINDYYVARYEGNALQHSAAPIPLTSKRPAMSTVEADLAEEDEDEDAADAPTTPQKKAAPVRTPRTRSKQRIVRTRGPVITGVGDVPIRVPFEDDDIMGSCYMMPNGSVMTAATSMGVFSTRDEVLGAIIPYAGVEAKLKLKPGVDQSWETPYRLASADLMKMNLNPAGYREFQAAAAPIKSLAVSSGSKVHFGMLEAGHYMIRGRLASSGKCVFLPLSVQ